MPKRRTSQETQPRKREITGVILAALGILLGVAVYTGSAGPLGDGVKGFLFGLLGMFAYAMPALTLVCGIAIIATSEKKFNTVKIALVIWALILTASLVQIAQNNNISGKDFFEYIWDAFEVCEVTFAGGGLLGALLTYPLVLLAGNVGGIIIICAALLIIIMLFTNLSLRKTGKKLGGTLKHGFTAVRERAARNPKNKLYNEQLSAVPTKPAKKGRKTLDDDLDFLPLSGPLESRANQGVQPPDDFEPAAFEEEDIEEPLQPVGGNVRPFRRPPRAPADVTGPIITPRQSHARGETAVRYYKLPPLGLMEQPRPELRARDSQNERQKLLLLETLKSFGVDARILDVSVGPVITRFELQPAAGVRVNRFTNLADDIALALAAPRVRIEAPIPGKAAIGIEIPNKDAATVMLREVLQSREFTNHTSELCLALGKDIAGKIAVADLARMPHLLIAGSTGSGKSVCINNIIISLLYRMTPEDLKLFLIDPKVVELKMYDGIPHINAHVVTDSKEAAKALSGVVKEMDSRYKLFASVGARDLARYNSYVSRKGDKLLPKMVVIIDELADLMMVAAADVEKSICRIAQLGRACGIHLVVATQRPSADVITGLIKANITSRIAFAVASQVDSRIILDSGGAEKLLGRGDMLFHPNGSGRPTRVQGAFVSDQEVERVIEFWKTQTNGEEPEYNANIIEAINAPDEKESGRGKKTDDDALGEDELLISAAEYIIESGAASISALQRKLRVGYARAGRLIDEMEAKGWVSGFDGSKTRRVLITHEQLNMAKNKFYDGRMQDD